jgi:hypothetical protein
MPDGVEVEVLVPIEVPSVKLGAAYKEEGILPYW